MLTFSQFEQIYFFRPFVDFRRGASGLCALVQEEMGADLFGKNLFIFCNRSRDRLKVLYWDETGFALWYKVLQKDKYRWPLHLSEDTIHVDVPKLESFLSGLDPWQMPHRKLNYSMT